MEPGFRQAIVDYVRAQAQPPDKFSHQPRLYALALALAEEKAFDDEVLFAAAWLHDLGVFVGHRPENPLELAAWDNVAYAVKVAPGLLRGFGFPEGKIAAVVEAIRTHRPYSQPASFEGELLRDADILEQLGAVGILRTVSKVGRDTRFVRYSDALKVLRKNLAELPAQLHLDAARRRAQPGIDMLRRFVDTAAAETGSLEL